MGKFRFWASIILSLALALMGYLLASAFPLPAPTTLSLTKAIYTATGAFIGLLIFPQVAGWFLKTTSQLARSLILRLASEIINQFTHLASAGMPFFTQSREQHGTIKLTNPIIIDTSALIDGRILDVAKTGFLAGVVLIPNFVLTELQQVADSADNIKRARGRRGFEIVANLKKIDGLKLEIWDRDLAGKTVDERLLRLGKILKGRVLTCDYNLNRLASVSGVRVLNLNDLANSLKSLPVPGERLTIQVVNAGKDKDQGVGYLNDGTMVVVKDAAMLAGQEIKTEVTKIIQSAAGRIIFANKIE